MAAHAEALVLLADWEMYYSSVFGTRYREAAIDRYRQAHALLESSPDGRRLVDEYFSPAAPAVLPPLKPASGSGPNCLSRF